MAEGAMSIVQLAAQKTATLLVNEGDDYLLAQNEQIEKLQLGLEWMRCFLKGVPKTHCIWKSQIRDFAHEVEDIIDKYLVRISLRNKEGSRNAVTRYFRDAKELRKIGDDIEFWSRRLAEFINRIRRFNSQVHLTGTTEISIPATTDIDRWPFTITYEDPSEQRDEIVGLDDDVKTLVKWLIHPLKRVIYIYGPSGSGKTTLAKKLCNDESVRSYFDSIVWISGSQKIGAREALETIWLNLCGGDYHDQRKRIKSLKDEELQTMVKVELEKNKYLIVFDSVRIEGSWAILRPALPVLRNSGSKLMLPTHYRVEMPQLAHSDHRFHWQMTPLKENNSWELLSKIASKGGYQPDNSMGTLWKEKIRRLDVIPLAVIVLGGVLKSKKPETTWQDVLKEIPEKGLLVKVLELSYNDLPFHLKCCFVRLANLPPGFEIPVENLYQMWVAEGLVTPQPDDPISPHEKAKDYLNELVKRCLVHTGRKGKNGEIDSCGMHSYIREFCLRKEKEEYFSSLTSTGREVDKIQTQMTKDAATSSKEQAKSAGKGGEKGKGATQDNKKKTTPQQNKPSSTTNVSLSIRRIHHLAIHQYIGRGKSQKEVLGAIQDREHLRSLLIISSRFKILPRNSWLKSLNGGSSMLRVLHLEDSKFRSLPHQIGELSHLRYLSLRGSKVTRPLPSSIGNLLMLETLDLRADGSYGMFHGFALHGYGDSVMVPNKLWKLKGLRRLYLPESYMVSKLRSLKVCSLTQLETLENLELRSCKVKGLAQLVALKKFTWMIQVTNGMFEQSDKKILTGLLACPCLANDHHQASTETESTPPPQPSEFMIKMNGEMLTDIYAKKLVEFTGYKKSVKGMTLWGPLRSKFDDVKIAFENLTSLVLRLTQLENDSDPLPILGQITCLQKLRLSYLSFVGTAIVCPAGGFLELVSLKLDLLPNLKDWTVEEGSMPKLKRLEIEYCDMLRKIPESLQGKVEDRVIYSRPADMLSLASSSSQQGQN